MMEPRSRVSMRDVIVSVTMSKDRTGQDNLSRYRCQAWTATLPDMGTITEEGHYLVSLPRGACRASRMRVVPSTAGLSPSL